MAEQNIKQKLHELLVELQIKKIESFKKAMDEAQQAANNEERSTAGDKYDTARAMSQNARDMNAKQLHVAIKEMEVLEKLKPEITFKEIKLGSLVTTENGNFYISISGGMLTFNGKKYFCVSPLAPIAAAMVGKTAGDSFEFREQRSKIIEVC